MAITPSNNEAFFREVDDQLRQEQMASFWKRYGRIVVVLVVLGLAAFAGVLWWQHHRAQAAGQEGEALTRVLNDLGEGKKTGAAAKLEVLAGSSRPAYAASAELTAAALALEGGDIKAAAARYKKVANDAKLPAPFRDLALVRQTAVEFDTLPPAQVIARLKPLAVAGSPWLGSAGEMVAVAHLKLNQPALAGPIFAAIARDETAPETLRSRASRMAGVLGIDTVAGPKAANKERAE